MKKRITILMVTLLAITSVYSINAQEETKGDDSELVSIIDKEDATEEDFEIYDEGYETIVEDLDDTYDPDLFNDDLENEEPVMSARAITTATVGYFSAASGGSNTNVFSSATSTSALTYVSASQNYSGMFPILEEANGRYRVVIAGVEGWISKSGVITENLSGNSAVNVYYKSGGKFYHKIYKTSQASSKTASGMSSVSQVGVSAPNYIKDNTNYYSFDGHYFYTNVNTMYNDYKAGTRNNSINPNNAYYNYYQYLSYRSNSTISAAEMKSYFLSVHPSATSTTHVMLGEEQAFIDQGNFYGANPLITYSMAILESGWGTSSYARGRNNLFGHSAYDSNPDSATYYSSITENLKTHNAQFINYLYMDASASLYNGGSVGDKTQGFNVKYSSDPYWGEKIASIMYQIDARAGNKDSNRYTIGYTTETLTVRDTSYTSGTKLYTVQKGRAIIIHAEVKGTLIEGTTKWYRIASDPLLNSNGKLYYMPNKDYLPGIKNYKVDLNKQTAYIFGGDVRIADNSSAPAPTYKKGDVNGDSKITILDLAIVKSHLLGNSKLSGNALLAADVNGDGKVTILDLAMIKSHLLGNSKID